MTDAYADTPDMDQPAQDKSGSKDIGQILLDLGQLPSSEVSAQPGGGYSFEPITDPALDQPYTELAQQHYAHATSGVLGTFQKLPGDGVSDRRRYTPPAISGPPATDENGNPCPAWVVTRPMDLTGRQTDHSFIVVADKPGAPPQARFSYGPSHGSTNQLVSLADSHTETDNTDRAAWDHWNNPLYGVRLEPIPASDQAVISAGRSLNRYLGTPRQPGPIAYARVPSLLFPGANSNSGASAVANEAIVHNPKPLNQAYLEPYPGATSTGWYAPIRGWKP